MKAPLISLCFLFFVLSTGTARAETSPQMEEMTWEEIELAIADGTDTAIITIGATEQHGPQIALASDSITGDYLGPEIARRLGRTLITPNIRVGVSPHHMYFPGTITVRSEILADFIMEHAHSLVWHGFRHIAILPTHGGNFTTVAEVGRRLKTLYPYVNVMAFADADLYISTLVSTSERLGVSLEVAGSHAGMSETSMALAVRPDLVRMNRASEGFMGDAYGIGERMNREGTRKVAPTGALGDPRPATAESGTEYLNDLAAMLSEFFEQGRAQWRPSPPGALPHGGLPEPEGDLAEGIRARRAGDIAAAKAFFEARMQLQPDDLEPRVQLGRTLILDGEYQEASRLIRPLLDSDDFRARLLANDELALIALYQGRFADAIRHKAAARDITVENGGSDEDEARRLMQIGYIQTEFGEIDAANASFAQALERVPGTSPLNLDVIHLAALAEIKQGRLHAAGERLRIIGDGVFDAGLGNQLRRFYQLDAELRIADGRPADALIGITRAIGIYDHPLYRETEARALLALNRPDAAADSLLHITRLTDARLDIPTLFVRAHYRLGRLYENQGRMEDAARLYEEFIGYWGDADAPLPEIRQARQALDRIHTAD